MGMPQLKQVTVATYGRAGEEAGATTSLDQLEGLETRIATLENKNNQKNKKVFTVYD